MKKVFSLNQILLYTDDFCLTSFTDLINRDAIVIYNPQNAIGNSGVFLRSKRTLEEHIKYIEENQIKKAVIIAEDISFLPQCQSLEYIRIFSANSADNFDYSPLYKMQNLKWLSCQAVYGINDEKTSYIDYSKMKSIKNLFVTGEKEHKGIGKLRNLKSILWERCDLNQGVLSRVSRDSCVENLVISQSAIRNLEGLENYKGLQRMELDYNRQLENIDALSTVKDSLRWLHIETCGKIKNFSVLSKLENLELLRLIGSNKLPDLSFLNHMPRLKFFVCHMNVENGDLSLCKNIPYVAITNRKHYNYRDKDFSKVATSRKDILMYMDD